MAAFDPLLTRTAPTSLLRSGPIALRPGDVILVEADPRSFTAMGATGAQTRVKFESAELTAIEALAQVGGLQTNAADPKGIFVLRDESAGVANSVLGRNDLKGTQRVAYVLNLTEPDGLFNARDFMIRDGDTIGLTDAVQVTAHRGPSMLGGDLEVIQLQFEVNGS